MQILTRCFLEVEQGSLLNQVFVFEYLSILQQNTLCACCVIEFSDEQASSNRFISLGLWHVNLICFIVQYDHPMHT